MAALLSARLLTIAACLASSTVAQLIGSLTYNGVETIQILIENLSQSNLTLDGRDNLFDRQNLMPYAPIGLTTLSGETVTMNGSRYIPPDLSDDVFQDIPPGGSYVRNLNMSEYLLGGRIANGPLTTTPTKSECFVATLPSIINGINVTAIPPSETMATYLLNKGITPFSIQSLPLHFNFTVPTTFTPDQAATIADDANIRRLAGLTSTAANNINASARFRRRR